tara:strand:- start:1568 stop:1948 length:381 start_codon:yes stop_codon:yes gene_type:complete
MSKRYLAKILARDINGLNIISLHIHKAIVKVSEIKYLKENKIFIMSMKRNSVKEKNKKVNSVCKFEFIDNAKSKKINQLHTNKDLEILAINVKKNINNYNFNLLFSNNGLITLSSETIEVTLEDLK